NLLVRDAQDPEVARWMRLRLTDYSGAELCQPSLTPELLKNLRAARALLFLVDHRSLPDLLPHDALPVTAGDNQRDAEELAAQYTRILQRYFDVNKDSLHLPVGLVVNKSDLLLGPTHLATLAPPFLVPERTKMELIHRGLRVQAEAADPFG